MFRGWRRVAACAHLGALRIAAPLPGLVLAPTPTWCAGSDDGDVSASPSAKKQRRLAGWSSSPKTPQRGHEDSIPRKYQFRPGLQPQASTPSPQKPTGQHDVCKCDPCQCSDKALERWQRTPGARFLELVGFAGSGSRSKTASTMVGAACAWNTPRLAML